MCAFKKHALLHALLHYPQFSALLPHTGVEASLFTLLSGDCLELASLKNKSEFVFFTLQLTAT